MDQYYYHPLFGYHQGVPIGGDESTQITEAAYLAGVAAAEQTEMDETDIYTLANRKLAAIQREKCRVRDSGVAVQVNGTDVLFDTDSGARIAYLEFLGMSGLVPNYTEPNWKASENTFVTMTQELFFAVVTARQTNERNAFLWQKAQVEAVAAAVADNDKVALSDVSEIYM